MARTSSIYDHLNVYLTPVTLDFNLREKNVSDSTSNPREQQLCKFFLNPCINVHVMAQAISIYDHFDLYLTPVTLTFNQPEKTFQMALLFLEENNCAFFLNPCINVQVMARTSLIYDHFDLYLTPMTLTFNPT